MASDPKPFRISVSDELLNDLRSRLASARIVPNEVASGEKDPNGSWAYGTDKSTLEAFVKYWHEEYDWRKHEAHLNEFSHFTLPVKGLHMHFVHERSQDPNAIPLLLVHGWPGSIVEFLKVIPQLRDAGFHVVAPSIPGYAWSEAPKERGADVFFMAEHMHALMQSLGYKQYVAQGGDWGSMITACCARRHPQHCVAYHSNFLMTATPPKDLYGILKSLVGLVTMPPLERKRLKATLYNFRYETAYQRIQGTKPQTLSYGLNDSPVGLLAWILEKFHTWADCGEGGVEDSGLTKDEILTNVMIYWVTQSIASSHRIYYETLGHAPCARMLRGIGGYVAVPTGVIAADDLFNFPRFFADLNYNIKHWVVPPKGGHFFAFEQPEIFVREVTHFFKKVLDFEECKRSCPKPGQGRPLEAGRVVLLSLIAAGAVKLASSVLKRSRM